MDQEEKNAAVIRKLKENGYRITAQRKRLIRVILENEYSSCKEIYFAARKEDQKIGMATVYRMVQLLENLELIHKVLVVRW